MFDSERIELEALREFKAMVDSAKQEEVSLAFKEKLKKEIPELYQKKGADLSR